MVKDKQYYINKRNEEIEADRQLYMEDRNGSARGFDWSSTELSVEGIVGQYLDWYGENALNQWLENSAEDNKTCPTDKEIAEILQQLFMI